MIEGYTFRNDEFFILGVSDASFEDSSYGVLRELMLTNFNLVAEFGTGLFGLKRSIRTFAIQDILWKDNNPSVGYRGGLFAGRTVEIAFRTSREKIHFANRDVASTWADRLQAVARDRHRAPQTKTVTKRVIKRSAPPAAAQARRIAVKCQMCGAPLEGFEGSVVRCEYCDSKQILRSPS